MPYVIADILIYYCIGFNCKILKKDINMVVILHGPNFLYKITLPSLIVFTGFHNTYLVTLLKKKIGQTYLI